MLKQHAAEPVSDREEDEDDRRDDGGDEQQHPRQLGAALVLIAPSSTCDTISPPGSHEVRKQIDRTGYQHGAVSSRTFATSLEGGNRIRDDLGLGPAELSSKAFERGRRQRSLDGSSG